MAAEKKMITMTSELHSAKEELKLTKSNLHRIKVGGSQFIHVHVLCASKTKIRTVPSSANIY